MLGLSVIILFKSLLHVFWSLVFSAHNSSDLKFIFLDDSFSAYISELSHLYCCLVLSPHRPYQELRYLKELIQSSHCKNCKMFSAIYWFVAKLCMNYFTIKCTCWQHKAHVCSKQPKVNKCDDNRFPIAINCCSLLWPSGPLVWYWPYICQKSQVVSNIPRRNTLLEIYRVMSQKCRGSVNLPQCPTEADISILRRITKKC